MQRVQALAGHFAAENNVSRSIADQKVSPAHPFSALFASCLGFQSVLGLIQVLYIIILIIHAFVSMT